MEGSVLHRYSPPPCAAPPPLPPVVLVSAVAIIVVFVSEEILCRVEKVHCPAAGLLPALYFAILKRGAIAPRWRGLLLVYTGK